MRNAIPAAACLNAGAFLCLCAALCASEQAKEGPGERWFGASPGDFSRAQELSGLPLKVKARFVRVLDPGAGRGKAARRSVAFLVEAEGGRIVCAIRRAAKDAELLREMTHATPVVVRGTVDAKGRRFLARSIVQGWGRSQLEGEP